MTDKRICVLAFSGGLDTTFCAKWLMEEYGLEVVPVTVDTGGFTRQDRTRLATLVRQLGTRDLVWRDARKTLFEEFLTYLIFGNCLKGGVYPFCVAAERTIQAREVAAVAREIGAHAVAHGSTGAGNDQIRFDGILSTLASDLDLLTPIRDLRVSREDEIRYLRRHGVIINEKIHEYSINRGMWGTTYGHRGFQNERDDASLEALSNSRPRSETPLTLKIGFVRGKPTSVDATKMPGYRIVDHLNRLGGALGVGWGIHIGTSTLGIKGRIAFQAPAATILIWAHRELEKVVLTRDELFWKGVLAEVYGDFLHRGLYLHPLMREIEAFLVSSQTRMTGEVSVRLSPGEVWVTSVDSPFSLFDEQATYGESASWAPEAVKGFIKFHHLESLLSYRRAGASSTREKPQSRSLKFSAQRGKKK